MASLKACQASGQLSGAPRAHTLHSALLWVYISVTANQSKAPVPTRSLSDPCQGQRKCPVV